MNNRCTDRNAAVFLTSFYDATGELLKCERQLQVLDMKGTAAAVGLAHGNIGADRRSARDVIVSGGRGRVSNEHVSSVSMEKRTQRDRR